MGETKNAVAPAQFPLVPILDDELLQLATPQRQADPTPPPLVALAQAEAYQQYAQRLAVEIDRQAREVAARISDEAVFHRFTRELAAQEACRRAGLQVFLANPAAKSTTLAAALMARMHECAIRELEAWRDARLRLELRRAELINQRVPSRIRVVLKGSIQMRLHFQTRKHHNATPQS